MEARLGRCYPSGWDGPFSEAVLGFQPAEKKPKPKTQQKTQRPTSHTFFAFFLYSFLVNIENTTKSGAGRVAVT